MDAIKIDGYKLKRVKYDRWAEIKIPIYEHQAATLDSYEDGKNVILCTKTGSGKTAAALFPLIKNEDSAIFVYPTNALIKNQLLNIYKTITKILGKKVHIRNESMMGIILDTVPPSEADICIHIINREALEEYANRGEIIQAILHDPSKQTLILTNPDTLFAILSLSYREHLNVVKALNRYKTIVIDEFHMYFGVQMANIIFMLKFAEKLVPDAFQRKIFLTATPNEESEDLLKDLFNVENPVPKEEYQKIDYFDILQPVLLEPHCLSENLNIGEVVDLIGKLKEEIITLREKYKNKEYVPCVIIVNSVIDAIHIEEEILKLHPEIVISPYRGLMSKSERKIESSHIVVGTSAIEVGIDFQCSYLIFEAGDASSFLQRFGRIGRHKINEQISTAYAFLPRNLHEYILDNKITKLNRNDIDEIIKEHYPEYSSYIGFVASDYGMVQAHIFTQKLQRLLEKWGEIKSHYKDLMDSYIQKIYDIFGIDEKRKNKIEKRLLRSKWFNSYLRVVSFRSTIPSVLVYDKREERSGRIPFYKTEVSNVLAKGTPCAILPDPRGVFYSVMKNFGLDKNLNEDLPMVLVENYDYQYTVSFDTIKNHVSCYPFCCDDPDLIIRRKRENYDFSTLFKNHIAMYIPSECYWLTDWRIKKFRTESNKYIIFDGDVLLYLSILDKENTLEILRAKSAEETSSDNII